MTFQELVDGIRSCFTPLDLDSDKGEFGFVNHSTSPISRIGYATNLSPYVAKKAIELGLHALITHHDAWEFLYESRSEVYAALKEHSISHCFIHAPLDAATFGTTATLAERLSLQIEGEFAEYKGFPCGRVCVPSSPLSFDDLAYRLSAATGAGIRVWQNRPDPIQRIGITTGGGSLTDLVREAVELGCDTYITGEGNLYMSQYAVDQSVNLLIGTHTHTEFPGVESLCNRLEPLTPLEFVPLHEPDIETGVLIQPS